MSRFPYETGYDEVGGERAEQRHGDRHADDRAAERRRWDASTPRYIRASASPNTSATIAHLAPYEGDPGTKSPYAIPMSTTVSAATGRDGAAYPSHPPSAVTPYGRVRSIPTVSSCTATSTSASAIR